MYTYKGMVVRVVDGDTVDIAVDLGFNTTVKERFRLADINAPERWDAPVGKESTDFLKELIEGKTVILHSTKTEKWGRWLATLHLYEDGVKQEESVNAIMVVEGHATHYHGS